MRTWNERLFVEYRPLQLLQTVPGSGPVCRSPFRFAWNYVSRLLVILGRPCSVNCRVFAGPGVQQPPFVGHGDYGHRETYLAREGYQITRFRSTVAGGPIVFPVMLKCRKVSNVAIHVVPTCERLPPIDSLLRPCSAVVGVMILHFTNSSPWDVLLVSFFVALAEPWQRHENSWHSNQNPSRFRERPWQCHGSALPVLLILTPIWT